MDQFEKRNREDSENDQVYRDAEAEWDALESVLPKNLTNDELLNNIHNVTTHEIRNYLWSEDFSYVRPNIISTRNLKGFSRLWSYITGPPKLRQNLHTERDLIFCLALTILNQNNSIHTDSLQTIFRHLTGGALNCPRTGNHWEDIGFQGADPSTDLRGVGILGLFNLIYLTSTPELTFISKSIYKLSQDATQNFPFSVMGLNITKIVLQSLRQGYLNRLCNRENAVFDVINLVYSALFHNFYLEWKSQARTIIDTSAVLKTLENALRHNAVRIYYDFKDHLLNLRKSSQRLPLANENEPPLAFSNLS